MKSKIKCWLMVPLFLAACRQPVPSKAVSRAFYYWKSTMNFTATETAALEKLQVKKLYVKFFDVVWDATRQQPSPVAKLQLTPGASTWLSSHPIEIVPTVFITNECMQQVRSSQLHELAANIHELIASVAQLLSQTNTIPEIQLDCDWTATTKDNYFSLLDQLKALPFFQQKQVSATIRLYQCKYKLKTGIPPVNRGLLMCYNMGNLKNLETNNSILEAAELEKYIGNLHEYPLPLDVALPLFDWKVLYRQRSYAGLIQQLPDSVLQQSGVAQQSHNMFTITRDTTLNDYAFKKGDVIRQEDANFAEIIKTTRLLRSKLVTPAITVALYHLDSLTLHKYSTNELEEIFDSMH